MNRDHKEHSMQSSINRSDYDAIFERSGPEGLMRVLHARFGDSPQLDRELGRMGKSGKWDVLWDSDTGEGRIVGRALL